MEETKNLNLVEQARIESQKLASQLEELKAERAKLEELRARDFLGGQTHAGTPDVKKLELSASEYAKRALMGQI